MKLTKQDAVRGCLLATALLCSGLLQPEAVAAATERSNALVNLERLNSVFTVTAFRVVNGVSEAVGMLTAEATDGAGVSVNLFTDAPVRVPMPLKGALAGQTNMLASASLSKDYVPPPHLGSNVCKILGVSIEFIDVTLPGLGLNVHVNELSFVVQADKETALGEVLCTLLGEDAYQDIDPLQMRTLAQGLGLGSLATVPVPEPRELDQILNPGPAARTAAIQLGKALFWDRQVGSDGVACASCHFHAGSDNRTRNALSPGLQRIDPALRGIFNDTPRAGLTGGPDYTLTEMDFPLHQWADPIDRNFTTRAVTFDTDDVVSSMGPFARNFTAVAHPLLDDGIPYVDPVFNLGSPQASQISNNVRRVEPRNAPSVINAVFTHANFWDGRAHYLFNGVSSIGPLDTNAAIWVNNGPAGAAPIKQPLRISNASLASQAVAPPTQDFEQSFYARKFPFVGVKLLSSGFRPLGQQVVHPSDSVLGVLSRYPEQGLNTYYTNLVQQAFQPKYWNGSGVAMEGEICTQMEVNFALFFGMAILLYERTLVSDQTPFDRFMAGDNTALTKEQLRGFLVFINQGRGRNPPAVESAIASAGVPIGAGNCVSCHSGPEFTSAAFTHLRKGSQLELMASGDTPVVINGFLALGSDKGSADNGFANIGVRPTSEDLGRGGTEGGFPLAFVRQASDTNLHFLLPPNTELGTTYPTNVQVDGAFKVPGLRNVELTGPYFHNGGQATLAQVVNFYQRQGDFSDVNLATLDRNMALVSLAEYDHEPLVKFLLALTDERVRQEQAPFDHPRIMVPVGGTFGNEQPFVEIPAVGSAGRPAAGLPPLGTFLGLPPLRR
jgi:cytochrome c peroxidase